MKRCYEYINKSFLGKLLLDNEITDISYNGESIYYFHKSMGRQKSDIEITKDMVSEFLRQLANLGEKLFSIANPFMDLSIGNYRLSAIHNSIARYSQEKCSVFSLRILSEETLDLVATGFMPKHIAKLFKALIACNKSIIISGKTGTGKTELQRYILELLPENNKVIIIDNIEELMPNKVVKFDQTFLSIKDDSSQTVNDLLKVSLRHNPDWIVIAESRGIEAKQALKSATTGHPIITTIHSSSSKNTPTRFMQMMEVDAKNYESILTNIYQVFPFIVFVDRYEENGKTRRYVKEILEINYEKKAIFNEIYRNDNNIETIKCLSNKVIEEIKHQKQDVREIHMYLGEKI